MNLEKVAEVMGWTYINDSLSCWFKTADGKYYDDLFDNSISGHWLSHLLVEKMVGDGWSVFTSRFAKTATISLEDPDGVAPGRIHCAAEIEQHSISGLPGVINSFGDNIPAAILALFCKVYSIGDEA